MSTNEPDRESPWSRPSVLISGALILALVLVGVIIAITSGGGGGGHKNHTVAQQPTPKTSASTSSTSTPTDSTACTLPAGSQAIPSAAPPAGTHWATVGSMQAPQAPRTLGPERTEGVFTTCFAHSPSGALLAAINLWAETTAANPSQVFQKLAVGAPRNLGNNERLDSGGPVQFAGYKIDSYAPSRASVSVVIKGPQGKLVAAVTPLIWNGHDWRYVFPAQGDPSLEVINDLTGYVPWSAF